MLLLGVDERNKRTERKRKTTGVKEITRLRVNAILLCS